ncbi:hypothetical protein EX30DRAFT_357800 [Ascodesmis nigricans]|uniref:Uncharacterized protein n=1 Tax=Ascodesmis nigricans TaxID=341454 RepID=A0A4S2N5D0_9PEZI|nr:hypothetical protein EX30DRAFT_357800 [Ascodesmis nigricans]
MEDTPLSIAHQHALHATKLLSASTPQPTPATLAAAAASHGLAATSFASAAKTAKDPEAHRTLELLVAQHERWAAGLKCIAERPAGREQLDSNASSDSTTVSGGSSTKTSGKSSSRDKPRTVVSPPPVLPFTNTSGVSNYPPRLQKSISSLATNLASARGIPQVPFADSSSGSRRRRPPANPTSESTSSKPTTSPLNLLPPEQPTLSNKSNSEETFTRFYSSLNSLIHRIGSPFTASLAFAGLPVGDDPNDNRIPPDFLPQGWVHGRTKNPDLGSLPSDITGGESFYVVPYSGGTMTYAGVVRRENAMGEITTHPGTPGSSDSRRRHGSSGVKKEVRIASPSPDSSGQAERDYETAKFAGHEKTPEELLLENQTLRKTLEQLTRDMAKWERKSREGERNLKNSIMKMSKNGGHSGMDILHQVQRSGWLHTTYEEEPNERSGGGIYSEGRHMGEMELLKEEHRAKERDLERKMKRLEEEVRVSRDEIRRLAKENERLKEIEKNWDALREKAKRRERAGTSKAATGATGGEAGRLAKVDEETNP